MQKQTEHHANAVKPRWRIQLISMVQNKELYLVNEIFSSPTLRSAKAKAMRIITDSEWTDQLGKLLFPFFTPLICAMSRTNKIFGPHEQTH